MVQILYQIPLYNLHKGEENNRGWQKIVGIFRLWILDEDIELTKHQSELFLKSIMFVWVIMQDNIFTSAYYKHFILVKLASIRTVSPIKALCLSYMHNNRKIKMIVKIQHEKKIMSK